MSYRRASSAADVVAAEMRKRGVDLDPLRLEETAAASRERRQLESREHLKAVQLAASAVVKTKRAYSQALAVMSRNPIAGNKQHAIDCKIARDAAREQLEELCLGDQDLVGRAIRQAHLR